MRPAKPQISLHIRHVGRFEYSMSVKLLTEHHLELLTLKEGCKAWSESTLVKMPHCLKSHVTMETDSSISFKNSFEWGLTLNVPITTAVDDISDNFVHFHGK